MASLNPRESAADARAAGLRYARDDEPGIRRRRAGRGFAYVGPRGRPVRDPATLERIRRLAIPPAYTDVWICADARGHVQATGRDARGRKQYRYHAKWNATRDAGKYDRVAAFASRLPALRRRLAQDLKRPGLPREKVLADAVAILATTLVRVGNDEYARTNKSFGLTTLRDSHAEFPRGRKARLEFRGKGGQRHALELDDPKLARLVRRCQQLPGQQLFQYVGEDGKPSPIGSGDVNDYLRDAMGDEFTAKDFRTWGGTLRAIEVLKRTALPDPPGRSAVERSLKQAIAEVAAHLRNTPAVCRRSYIHPAVIESWSAGTLAERIGAVRTPAAFERAALRLLRGAARVRPRGSAPRTTRARRSTQRPARSPRSAPARGSRRA